MVQFKFVNTFKFFAGNLAGFTTFAVERLKNETNTNIQSNDESGSWFASLLWLLGILGWPLGGYLAGVFGRRRLIISTAPIGIVGWAILG